MSNTPHTGLVEVSPGGRIPTFWDKDPKEIWAYLEYVISTVDDGIKHNTAGIEFLETLSNRCADFWVDFYDDSYRNFVSKHKHILILHELGEDLSLMSFIKAARILLNHRNLGLL